MICTEIIDLNYFWIVFNLFFIKIKCPKVVFFFIDFKITCENVEILMKVLVFYSLINYFIMNSFFDLKSLEEIFLSLSKKVSTFGHLNKENSNR